MRRLSNHTCRLICLILALIGLMSGLALPGYSWSRPLSDQATTPQVTNPSWSITGNLNTARYDHTTTLLSNGQVLVVGGVNDIDNTANILNSAELYNPATGTWSITGNLNTARYDHTATLLPNGQVLVAGGRNGTGNTANFLNSAELYDPATGTWSMAVSLNVTRSGHIATLLANGQILVAGGWGYNADNSAELYNPATGTWSYTGKLYTTHVFHTAMLLSNGKVLVAGNVSDASAGIAEIYDPATGTWSVTGSINQSDYEYTATLLQNGKVLATGGVTQVGYFFQPLARTQLYDSATGTWSYSGNLITPRTLHTATVLSNGQVLVTGGSPAAYSSSILNSAELYDPATGTWSGTGKLNQGRSGHTATLLQNGKVLVVGGENETSTLNSAELFDLGLPPAGTVASVSSASYSLMGLASESMVTGFGAGLAVTTVGATTLPLPTELAGTRVLVKDSAGTERLAPLFYVSPTQVNYLIPPGTTTAGAATVTIRSGDGTVSTGLALVNAVAPSLFAANANGQGVAVAIAVRVKADGSQSYEEIAQFDTAQNKFISRPLDLGPESDQVYLLLFGTGIHHRSSLSAVITTIGGAYAEVGFAGAQADFAGLDQINVLLPRSLAGRGEVDVLLTVDAQMANPVRINIK